MQLYSFTAPEPYVLFQVVTFSSPPPPGEGAINLALAPNRGQDVRINGPVGPGNSVRMETGFPMQGSQGKFSLKCLDILYLIKYAAHRSSKLVFPLILIVTCLMG